MEQMHISEFLRKTQLLLPDQEVMQLDILFYSVNLQQIEKKFSFGQYPLPKLENQTR